MNEKEIKQSDLLYDYIKFHLGLYLATPALVAIIANSLKLQESQYYQYGLLGMATIYFFSGVHASWFVASHVNVKWTPDKNWVSLGESADSLVRRTIHHYFYWLGLIVALGALAAAKFFA